MKTLLLCCLALWCLCPVIRAEEASAKISTNVPGAFGIVFGRPLPAKTVTRTMDSDLEVAVQLKPTTPSPYLNRYVARINPTTKAVYELQGWWEAPDDTQKAETFEKLAAALASKYGPNGGTTAERQVWDLDGVTIDLSLIKSSVVLTYTHSAQKKQADKALEDRVTSRTRKDVNTTGL